MKDDINRLFQKFIDKTINEEEFKMFSTYLRRSETDPQIRQLLTEVWDYITLTDYTISDDQTKDGTSELQRKQRLLKKLVEDNEQQHREIAAAIKKINDDYNNQESANKKQGWLDWIKRLFVIAW